MNRTNGGSCREINGASWETDKEMKIQYSGEISTEEIERDGGITALDGYVNEYGEICRPNGEKANPNGSNIPKDELERLEKNNRKRKEDKAKKADKTNRRTTEHESYEKD